MSVESPVERMPVREGATAGAIAWVAGLVLWGVLLGGRGGLSAVVVGYSALHLWALLAGFGPEVLVFSLIPIVILAGAGYVVASRTGTREWIPVGGSVAVGYSALAVPSHLLVFPLSGSLVIAVGFTGVVVPVVFAGLGGTFASGTPAADDGEATDVADGDG